MVPKHPLIEKTEWGSEGPCTEAPEDIPSDAGGQTQQELLAVLCKSSHSSNTRCQNTNPLQNCKIHLKTRSHWSARPSSTAAGYWCRYCSPQGTFPAWFSQSKFLLAPDTAGSNTSRIQIQHRGRRLSKMYLYHLVAARSSESVIWCFRHSCNVIYEFKNAYRLQHPLPVALC